MSQLNFSNISDRLNALGVSRTVNVQGHTLQLGTDITVDFAQLTSQPVAAPAAKADEAARITHARDNMETSAKAMIDALVRLSYDRSTPNATMQTMLGKMWEATVHQQRLNDMNSLHPQQISQTVARNKSHSIRSEKRNVEVPIPEVQQEQLALLLYKLSDADLIRITRTNNGELMDALDEALTDLGKSNDEAMKQNIRSMHDCLQKLRLAVLEETSTRLTAYGNAPEGEGLRRALTALHKLNVERLQKGELFVKNREQAQCQEEVQNMVSNLHFDELELSEKQQNSLRDIAKSEYPQHRESLHAQARQALMDQGHAAPTTEMVQRDAVQLFCDKLCASIRNPSLCEKTTGFRAALFAHEAAFAHTTLGASLQDAAGKHVALQPFAKMLTRVAIDNPSLLQSAFTAEASNLRTLLQGGAQEVELFNENFGGFHPTSEQDLSSAVLVRASMNLLRQAWTAINNLGQKPMQPEVWSCLLNCAGEALHVHGFTRNDVARLMPLALQKASTVADQLRGIAQCHGKDALRQLTDTVGNSINDIPDLRPHEKSVMASAVIQLAEAMLTQNLGEALPLQSPNERLKELAQNVKESPDFLQAKAHTDEAAKEYQEALVTARTAADELQRLSTALDDYDFGASLKEKENATKAKLSEERTQIQEKLKAARDKVAKASSERDKINAHVQDLRKQVISEAGKVHWKTLAAQLLKVSQSAGITNESELMNLFIRGYTEYEKLPDLLKKIKEYEKLPDALKKSMGYEKLLASQMKTKEYEKLSAAQKEIYDQLVTLVMARPSPKDMANVQIDEENQAAIKELLEDQFAATLAYDAAQDAVTELESNLTDSLQQADALVRETQEKLTQAQVIGNQLRSDCETARDKLNAATLALASKTDKLADSQDVVYGIVWLNPANFNKLIPLGTPIAERYAKALARHNTIDAELVPLRAQVAQAATALEVANTAMRNGEAAHEQAMTAQQTELAALQMQNSDLHHRGEELREQNSRLAEARDVIHASVQHSAAECKAQHEELLKTTANTLEAKQEELTALGMQVQGARTELANLQQGQHSPAEYTQWAEDEIGRNKAQLEHIDNNISALVTAREPVVARIKATKNLLLDKFHLPYKQAPAISTEVLAKTLKKVPKAEQPTVTKVAQNYNLLLNQWLGVHENETELYKMCTAQEQDLANCYSKMANLRSEQVELFVAQSLTLPWSSGPRPTNIADRLISVERDIQACTATTTAHTNTVNNFRAKLETYEKQAAAIATDMQKVLEELPVKSDAREMAELTTRYINSRNESAQLRHQKLAADVNFVQQLHQSAYASAVLRLLGLAEARGVQDTLAQQLSINETHVTQAQVKEAQDQLTSLEERQKTITTTIAELSAEIQRCQSVIDNPHRGVDQQSLNMAEQAVTQNIQTQEDNTAILQKNEASISQLSEELMHRNSERMQAVEQELQNIHDASTALHTAQSDLHTHEDSVAAEEKEWEEINATYENYTRLMADKQPLTDMASINKQLNDTACLESIAQDKLPLNDKKESELPRLSRALRERRYPASFQDNPDTLLLMHDGPPVARGLLRPEMLNQIMDDTIINMPDAITAMLKHDASLSPWADLFSYMSDRIDMDTHPLMVPLRSQFDNIMRDNHSMTADQWKTTYGDPCSLESMVRLACLRAMRDVVSQLEHTVAMQSDDLTLLLQGYSLDAIRQIREKEANVLQQLSEVEKRALPSRLQHLQNIAKDMQFSPTMGEDARRDRAALAPLLTEIYSAMNGAPPYVFSSMTDTTHTPVRTVYELDGIVRFHQQARDTLGGFSMSAASRNFSPNNRDQALRDVANLVKNFILSVEDHKKLFGPLAPSMIDKLRTLLLETPALSLARNDRLRAQQVIETLNSEAFLYFAGHAQHLYARDGGMEKPHLKLLGQGIDYLLTMRDVLNKELCIHNPPPVPRHSYAPANIPQTMLQALQTLELPASANAEPIPVDADLSTPWREACIRLEGAPLTNNDRLRFLSACQRELNSQQYEQNLRATLYGAMLCSLVRSTGSEVDEDTVFLGLAGHDVPNNREEALQDCCRRSLPLAYRGFMLSLMDGNTDALPGAIPSLEKQVVKAALKLEAGTFTAQDAATLSFALPINADAQEMQSTAQDLLQQCTALRQMSDPCYEISTRFEELRTAGLLANPAMPGVLTIAGQIGDFASLRARVASHLPLPSSGYQEDTTKYDAIYKETEQKLAIHAERVKSNADMAGYLNGILNSNAHLFPRLLPHAKILQGVI